MVNISLAPAILATSTPAPAPEKAAPAPPAAANTRLAPVHLLILGAMALALAPQHINTLVPVPATPAAPAPLAVASIQNVLANQATHGKMAPARNKRKTVLKVSCIIAMAKLLVYVLQVWASMLRREIWDK